MYECTLRAQYLRSDIERKIHFRIYWQQGKFGAQPIKIIKEDHLGDLLRGLSVSITIQEMLQQFTVHNTFFLHTLYIVIHEWRRQKERHEFNTFLVNFFQVSDDIRVVRKGHQKVSEMTDFQDTVERMKDKQLKKSNYVK